jgi:isopentenyl phosphate kinase
MNELVFVKLGGSILTDKSRPETSRPEVIARLAQEVASALAARSGRGVSSQGGLRLVLAHGSGSFGHVAARRYGTRQGVHSPADWQGFAQVAGAAARLNQIVTDAFLAVGVPVWSLQPSASARCVAGALVHLDTSAVERALAAGLVPLLYGDVALDEVQGATIISTEQIFAFLARCLHPARLILVGVVDGVFEADPLSRPSARHVPEITPANWQAVRAALGGSHATDVTGGMLAKVEEMVRLVREMPQLEVSFLSGEAPGALERALVCPGEAGGTWLRWK